MHHAKLWVRASNFLQCLGEENLSEVLPATDPEPQRDPTIRLINSKADNMMSRISLLERFSGGCEHARYFADIQFRPGHADSRSHVAEAGEAAGPGFEFP